MSSGALLVLAATAGVTLWWYSRWAAAARREAEEGARAAIEVAGALSDAGAGEYVRHSRVTDWLSRHPKPTRLLLSAGAVRRLHDEELRTRYTKAAGLLTDPHGWAQHRNAGFVREELHRLSAWFDRRLGAPLTPRQRVAVITDEDANLIVAGAGSGKTSTLLAKIAYLSEQRGVDPKSILVLAFNRDIADEIRDRVGSLGLPMPEISTFHAKGFEIIGMAHGRRPAVSSLAEDSRARRRFLAQVLKERLGEDAFRSRFRRWWVELRVEAWELRQLDSPDERLRRERSLGLRTLDGTLVRSQSEVKVGNWLTLTGIAWRHEETCRWETGSSDYRDYTPDFYLPDDDVWIEVWACDEAEEKFPPEIDVERYRQGMEWKRRGHRKHGTILVEINQTDIWGGHLTSILEARLSQAGVTLGPLNEAEVDKMIESIQTQFDPLVSLLDSFLSLYRAGGWAREAVEARAESPREQDFLHLFWPFLEAYERHLAQEGKIDFDAMLVEASRVRDRSTLKAYQYILVDEYQDTSRARLELLQSLRGDPSSCRLFLVGDDWQSIYRFTGSDISYFTQAGKHVGTTERTDLDRTFRLSPDVCELSMEFIQKNPHQLRKSMEPHGSVLPRPGVSLRLHPPGGESKALRDTLHEIESEGDRTDSILVLGRYNFLLEIWHTLLEERGCRLRNRALTVHRAKGLEADHVILFGLSSGTFGFPTEIEDDRVLQLLLGEANPFANAEERRLFYVALTRTRSRVYLLADADHTSPFVQELLEDEYAPWVDLFGEESERYRCPRCRGKTVRRREGAYGPFWGCINYSACRGRLPVCRECGTGVLEPTGSGVRPSGYRCTVCNSTAPTCPRCSTGALVQQQGEYGSFLGCTEWRRDKTGCNHTVDLTG